MKLLSISPAEELVFTKTQSQSTPNQTLKLTNISSSNVAFKVKTTAPKSYLVRPSSGTLKKGSDISVQIIMQPHVVAPPGGNNAEGLPKDHRFLVQAVVTTGSDPVEREQWSSFKKEDIEEKRLNVKLEEPGRDSEGNATPADGAADYGAPEMKSVASAGWQDSGAAGSIPNRAKYEELVQYTYRLDKEKKDLEEELKELKKRTSVGAKGDVGGGYTKRDIFLVAVIVFILSYAAKFLG